MTAWWLTGDTRAVMAELPAGSVDLVLTSPPFLALRSYLPDDDPAKVDEIGSEANPAEFIDTLLDVTEACARLLAPHGTLCVELGDTYSGSGGAGGDYAENGLREGQAKFRQRSDGGRYPNGYSGGVTGRDVGGSNPAFDTRPISGGSGWPQAKSLALIPEAYRWALAYGRNPHNGRSTDPWRIRNVIRWVRPNPPVGALGDKFRPATSEMVVACKAKDRWFDLDAVRTPLQPGSERPGGLPGGRGISGGTDGRREAEGATSLMSGSNPAGAPPLDWWQISPGGYSGAHYATWPSELCVKPIEAMCPRRVCRTCGTPSRRQVEQTSEAFTEARAAVERGRSENTDRAGHLYDARHSHTREAAAATSRIQNGIVKPEFTTTGWSSCACPGSDGIRLDGYHTGPGWRPGIVLDVFSGSGTTGVVATGHGRDFIGIDLDSRNEDLARDRIGPMFFKAVTANELRTLLEPAAPRTPDGAL